MLLTTIGKHNSVTGLYLLMYTYSLELAFFFLLEARRSMVKWVGDIWPHDEVVAVGKCVLVIHGCSMERVRGAH